LGDVGDNNGPSKQKVSIDRLCSNEKYPPDGVAICIAINVGKYFDGVEVAIASEFLPSRFLVLKATSHA